MLCLFGASARCYTPALARPPLLYRSATSKSSNLWLARQSRDPHVLARGSFRARSAFKLLEILKVHRLVKGSTRTIVDLGSAPGSWSQVLLQTKRPTYRGSSSSSSPGGGGKGGEPEGLTIVAVDLLAMDPLPGVHFIQGDFLEPSTQAKIAAALRAGGSGSSRADLVVSDMAGRVSGNVASDREEAMKIMMGCLDFAKHGLRKAGRHTRTGLPYAGGSLVMKHFTFPEFDEFKRKHLKRCFESVHFMKPEASRSESAEAFWICKGWKGDLPEVAKETEPEEDWEY